MRRPSENDVKIFEITLKHLQCAAARQDDDVQHGQVEPPRGLSLVEGRTQLHLQKGGGLQAK